jgi:hypothetical protein
MGSTIWQDEIRLDLNGRFSIELPVVQQAQAVGDDQQGRAHVGGDGHPERRPTEKGQQDEYGLDAERESDVLLDGAQRAASVMDEPGESRQVVGHEGDIGQRDSPKDILTRRIAAK